MGKAQISADFLVISAAVLLLFLVLVVFYTNMLTSIHAAENVMSAQLIADSLARGINAAERGGNGTVAVIEIPESLSTGEPYDVSILSAGRRVETEWFPAPGRRSAASGILTSAINDLNITKVPGSGPTNVTIRNSEGVVNVSA